MPIRPEQKPLYPSNWPSISYECKRAAGWCCQSCGVRHMAWGWRDAARIFHPVAARPLIEAGYGRPPFTLNVLGRTRRILAIVLTTAHLNHDPTDNRPENLAVLCQQCHLDHDRKHHRAVRAARARAAMKTAEMPLPSPVA